MKKVVAKIKRRFKLMTNQALADELKALETVVNSDRSQLDWHREQVKIYEARIRAIESAIAGIKSELKSE